MGNQSSYTSDCHPKLSIFPLPSDAGATRPWLLSAASRDSPSLLRPCGFGTAGALTALRQRRQRRQQPPQHRPPGLSHTGSGTPLPFLAPQSPGTPLGRSGSPGAQRSFPLLGFPLQLRVCRSPAGQSLLRRECMPHFYQKQKRKQPKYPPFSRHGCRDEATPAPRPHRMSRLRHVPGAARSARQQEQAGLDCVVPC